MKPSSYLESYLESVRSNPDTTLREYLLCIYSDDFDKTLDKYNSYHLKPFSIVEYDKERQGILVKTTHDIYCDLLSEDDIMSINIPSYN